MTQPPGSPRPRAPQLGARGPIAPRDGGSEGEGATDALDALLKLLTILGRRWLVIAVTTVLAVAVGVLAISLVQPQWRATATLVVNPSGPQVLDKVRGVNEEEGNDRLAYKQYFETQREIISSRKVNEAALAQLGLSDDPTFLGTEGIRDAAQREEAEASLDPVARLQSMITIEEVRGSRVMAISAEYPDPEIARDIANEVAQAYLAHITRRRSDTGDKAKTDLEAELVTADAELQKAERDLEEFKREHRITSISLEDRQNLIAQSISTLTTAAKNAQAERIEIESTYRQAKKLHAQGSLAGASLLSSGERIIFDRMLAERLEAERDFSDIDVRYGQRHPQWRKAKGRVELIDKRIESESKGMIRTLEARYKAAAETEAKLEAALAAERDGAIELGRLEPAFRQLERESQNAAASYARLRSRTDEIGVSNRVEIPPVEVLDLATSPEQPVRPRKPLLLGIAAFIGLSLGAVFAVVVDLRDHRIRSVVDLERALSGFGLTTLGQLPLLPADPALGVGNVRAQRRRRDLYTHLFPQSLMAERCRGIRTSLAFMLSNEGSLVLLVTSPASAEGKSSTAMNLALSYCQAQKKVCLVDADMRRPRLHQVFPPPVGKEEYGLATVLEGTHELVDALQGDLEGAPETLEVLTCGRIPDNPAELLESPACRKVTAELRERFDVVIIDSPPALPVTDPLILAPQVDGVVMVARCRSTTRTDIQRALTQLRQGDNNLLGVVLNELDARDEGRRYSSEYYTYQPHEEATEGA
ncbi:putative tyrosine-protein kinase in cps region [Enhygromyxa salina]|uniref:Putative tyrosine-protein kinase in cps region n=1 Tax=Enhygromyxa salina TaxID=215803 RepID=A0A2S9XUE8_9BACT|nr:polysaccharide biosynthesis tyrosine autokinase [Enhygromyxa salina]PRP96498.1 putative tyrosine-protein kinase in cps region [Enhygromyxa salina]